MTDKVKLLLIHNMITDVMEFTDYGKDALDALATCVLTIIDFKTEEDE